MYKSKVIERLHQRVNMLADAGFAKGHWIDTAAVAKAVGVHTGSVSRWIKSAAGPRVNAAMEHLLSSRSCVSFDEAERLRAAS